MSGRTSLLRALLALVGAWSSASAATEITPSDPREQSAGPTEKSAAAARYISNLESVVAAQIVPRLERGILSTAKSRPRTLTVELTEDASPYHVGARTTPDGSLIVRLSLGYTTMHDAALDAAGMSAALNRERDLRKYLAYQLHLAHENHTRRARHETTTRAMTFAEFARLDPKTIKALFVQPDWRARRERAQVESLGWVVSYFLVKADPRLAGTPRSATIRDGEGAARLAAASGWFPVPPFATAFGLSAIERSAATPPDGRALLCRTARLMETGLAVTRENTQWRSRLEHEASLRSELAKIQEQVNRMRRDGHCASTLVTRNWHALGQPAQYAGHWGRLAVPRGYQRTGSRGRLPSASRCARESA